MKKKNIISVVQNIPWLLVGGTMVIANIIARETKRRPTYDFVPVTYVRYSNADYNGVYDIKKDHILINTVFEPDTYYTLAHELKHSHNAQLFSYQINTDADELSARFAARLARRNVAHRRIHVLDSLVDVLPTSAMMVPMIETAAKRFPTMPYMDALAKLRAEKQTVIDSIAQNFDGAIRDSLIGDTNDRYSETTQYTIEYEKIMERFVRTDKQVFARDLNYDVGILEQRDIDACFTAAMQEYRDIRAAYKVARMAGLPHAQFRPMTDAELEKLFTFKINGVHRSLFKEASPNIRAQVRRMTNADNLMMRAKFAFERN